MKKIVYTLLILPLLMLFSGCDNKEEIVFDHEQPQFELKENAILLEVIMPLGSSASDLYYIVGDFNGGEEAIGNMEWQLEKAENSTLKWGIYLLPSTFKEGKTLANGFYLVSKKQGEERSVMNTPVLHTLTVGVGTRTNVQVSRWEAYFGNVDKDTYTVYVNNQSDWGALSLYFWSDGITTPAWPGLQPSSTEVINGVTYTCFEISKEFKEKTLNLIFNNNGGGSQFDGAAITLERDFYYLITSTTAEKVDPNVVPYRGYTVYVDKQTDWAALALYFWADGATTPDWPGLQPTGTKVLNGVTYTYFEMGEERTNQSVNLIINNSGGGSQKDGPYATLNRDYYLQLTDSGFIEVDPNEKPIVP